MEVIVPLQGLYMERKIAVLIQKNVPSGGYCEREDRTRPKKTQRCPGRGTPPRANAKKWTWVGGSDIASPYQVSMAQRALRPLETIPTGAGFPGATAAVIFGYSVAEVSIRLEPRDGQTTYGSTACRRKNEHG
jgi:hypothetical protein